MDKTFEEKVKECKSMPELDSLKIECVQEMKKAGIGGCRIIQEMFIKQKKIN